MHRHFSILPRVIQDKLDYSSICAVRKHGHFLFKRVRRPFRRLLLVGLGTHASLELVK